MIETYKVEMGILYIGQTGRSCKCCDII